MFYLETATPKQTEKALGSLIWKYFQILLNKCKIMIAFVNYCQGNKNFLPNYIFHVLHVS